MIHMMLFACVGSSAAEQFRSRVLTGGGAREEDFVSEASS